jgi:hypothetical protein
MSGYFQPSMRHQMRYQGEDAVDWLISKCLRKLCFCVGWRLKTICTLYYQVYRVYRACKLLNLKVGTARFELAASCTPTKTSLFPPLSLLLKTLINIGSRVLDLSPLIPVFHPNMSLQYVSVEETDRKQGTPFASGLLSI